MIVRKSERDPKRPKRDITEFGRWLQAEMATRSMNQADLAKETDVQPSTVSKWIYDSTPSPANCDLIAAALRIPLDRVLDAAGHRPTREVRGEIRLEIANMLQMIPEELLVGVAVQLRGLTQPAEQERAMRRLRSSFAKDPGDAA